jgi:hypothetical protein
MSYHNGSVWPHDNAMIATGLARYGDGRAAAQIFQGMFDATTYMDLRRLPELFCGFPRFRGRGPTLYPVACAPQAWASGAFFALLQASLGIEQDPLANVIRFRNPTLPAFLDSVALRGLKAGAGSVDLSVHRRRDDKIFSSNPGGPRRYRSHSLIFRLIMQTHLVTAQPSRGGIFSTSPTSQSCSMSTAPSSTSRQRPRAGSILQSSAMGADRVVVLSALRRRSYLFPPAGGGEEKGFCDVVLQGMVDLSSEYVRTLQWSTRS